MSKRQGQSSGNVSLDGAESDSSLGEIPMGADEDSVQTHGSSPLSKKNDDEGTITTRTRKDKTKKQTTFTAVSPSSSIWKRIELPNTKQIALVALGFLFAFILYECFFVDPEDRVIKPDFSDKFLNWVQDNPTLGLGAILVVIAAAVVSLMPIGTPLTVGCGYIYRGVYGWKMGIFVSTVVSMAGSALGAITCFLLGRYLIKDTVRRWVRNYPMFDAIDVGKSFCCHYMYLVKPIDVHQSFEMSTLMRATHLTQFPASSSQ